MPGPQKKIHQPAGTARLAAVDVPEKDVRAAIARLEAAIGAHASMLVAYSGGVDSGLLAYVAHQVLGERMLAVTGVSASFSSRDAAQATAFLENHRIPSYHVFPGEIDDPRYRANAGDRCFFCKEALFTAIAGDTECARYETLAYGANLDDRGDHRPGAVSASQRGVVAPLADAGFGKAMVRAAAKLLGLEIWDRPAAPCLASRIPYHTEVTPERLQMVERAEAVLEALGFRERRVRHFDTVARIELPLSDHPRARGVDVWSEIESGVRDAGFATVVLASDGLRSGRLNEVLGRSLDT